MNLKGASFPLCLALDCLSWPRKPCLKLLGFDLLLWVFSYVDGGIGLRVFDGPLLTCWRKKTSGWMQGQKGKPKKKVRIPLDEKKYDFFGLMDFHAPHRLCGRFLY